MIKTATVALVTMSADAVLVPETPDTMEVIGKGNDEAIVLLVGDASMKSHYRLGVGINRILDSYHESIRFYHNVKRTMLGEAKLSEFIVEFARYIEGKLQYFVEFQASTIFMEAFCDFIVFFNPMNDLNLAQNLVRRDRATHDYVQMRSTERKKSIEKCMDRHADVMKFRV